MEPVHQEEIERGSDDGRMDPRESISWSEFQRDPVPDTFFEDPTSVGTWNRPDGGSESRRMAHSWSISGGGAQSGKRARGQEARKWIQQKKKGWKIIIDYLSVDIERYLQRVPAYENRMATHNVRFIV